MQVKTPTKTRFGHGVQCGDKSFSSPEVFRRSKDDLSIKNDRTAQAWGRRRRFSEKFRRDEAASRKKRLRSTPYIGPLPSKFLNGGSIEDPLNLNSLDSSELGRQLNTVTPESSPLPTPRRQSVEVRVPFNITDPLNLNDSDEDADIEKLWKKRKTRNRHRKKEDTSLFSPPKHINKDKNLLEALKIDVEPEPNVNEASVQKEFVKPRSVSDKIVSPVIRQDSPKVAKRRRTNSGGKPDTSTPTARSLPVSIVNSSTKNKLEKKISPKKQKIAKSAESSQSGQLRKSDKSSMKFVYGNYNRYYGYRNPCMEEDKRMNSLKKEWFEGKTVLDIGCNVGQLTLSIARDYQPSKIVGMDIDAKLISVARKNIRFYMSSSVTDTQRYPVSCAANFGPIAVPPVTHKGAAKSGFPHNVLFMQGNYVLESDELLDLQKEEYDVVLALSVTKWIHFNWGDTGLKRFFKRVYKQLRPGGKFILEPQPWSSYKKKKKLTAEIFENFKSIHLRPEQFTDYLLSREVGFSTCNTIDVPFNPSKGFRRPIIVFTKSETVQNSPWSEMGSVTPVRSHHHPTFSSHLTHISEDSSCSCSSYSQQSVSGESMSNPAPSSHAGEPLSHSGSVFAEDSFPNPPSLDTGSYVDSNDAVDHHVHSSITKESAAVHQSLDSINDNISSPNLISAVAGTSSSSKTGTDISVAFNEDRLPTVEEEYQSAQVSRKRSYSDSDLSARTFDDFEPTSDSANDTASAKRRKEDSGKGSTESDEVVNNDSTSCSENLS